MSNSKTKKTVFFIMTKKGLYALEKFIAEFGAGTIDFVISSRDSFVLKDYYDEIAALCSANKIRLGDRKDNFSLKDNIVFAIGWKWLIEAAGGSLYVFHDSLLPRYRGFSTLVSQLLNKEESIGVTCFCGQTVYDTGGIVSSAKIDIVYPVKIERAIDEICPLYSLLLNELFKKLRAGEEIVPHEQNERLATYSVWRDEEDYNIEWQQDSVYIRRFIDSVGFPYRGAKTTAGGRVVRITSAEANLDYIVENRGAGKVLFIEDGFPVVICGKGMLKITAAYDELTGKSILPFKHFRTRFY
jgi:methionyl-tRNA formyltransferase